MNEQISESERRAREIRRAKRKNKIDQFCNYGNHVAATEEQLVVTNIGHSDVRSICILCNCYFTSVNIYIDA